MKKAKKVFKVAFLLSMFAAQAVSAQGTWGNARTFSLNENAWKIATTQGEWLSSYKQTNSSNFDAHTVAKTMWTFPSIRVVNANRQLRSNQVVTAREGSTATGSGNTGEIGYNYYGEVRKAAGQLGTDTIRLQLRVR